MKQILTLVFLLSCSYSFSQGIFRPALSFGETYCNKSEIVAYSRFINKFSSPNLKFVRIENTLSAKWTSAFCDCEFCYGVTTDEANFTIPIGDSCTTSAHFYADGTKGQGLMKVKISPQNDPTQSVIGEFRASCWGASATFLDAEQLVVSPNPATNVLNVSFGSGEAYTISIIGFDGRLISKEIVDGLNHNADISFLTSGLYSLKVESAGKVFYAKFIKH